MYRKWSELDRRPKTQDGGWRSKSWNGHMGNLKTEMCNRKLKTKLQFEDLRPMDGRLQTQTTPRTQATLDGQKTQVKQ